MPTSNENDAKSFNKLALLASAAATAAFVITQTRLMQRLAEPAPSTPTATPPPPEPEAAPYEETDAEEPRAAIPDNLDEASDEDASGEGAADANDEPDASPPPSGGIRLRFRASRTQRERLHYGLPVSKRRRTPAAARPVEPAAAVAVLDRPAATTLIEAPAALLAAPAIEAPRIEAPTPVTKSDEDFDDEYMAICEAIARDGRLDDEEESEDEIDTAPAAKARDALEDMWWLPAPRIRYLLLMLAYVAISAAVGSDPITLAGEGLQALTTLNTTADFVLLAWALCGLVVILPVGGLLAWLVSTASRGKLHLPALHGAGVGLRLLATSAFLAGAVLYTPRALELALDTDYPVAAVSSDSMSPALHEGELVFLHGVDSPDELKVGDIIAFKHDGGLAVRRVAGFKDDAILMRADASPNDELLITVEDVAGKAMHVAGAQVKLPLLGNISLLGERTVDPEGSPLSSLP
jgi:Peptidase S24-like